MTSMQSGEVLQGAEESVDSASEEQFTATRGYWHLVWRRFRRHRVATVSAVSLGLIYTVALLAELVAPHGTASSSEGYQNAPPQVIPPGGTSDGRRIGLRGYGYPAQEEEG